MTTSTHLSANVERFSGFAERYDAFRPQPPRVLLDILTQLARIERPRLVVDLGSGTGLSTRAWTERAETVIGVEPNADMRRQAEERNTAPDLSNVRYQEGYSHATGLADGCADIVTCSQSLHWMEPEPTFAEIARILRPGGVFAAYDCDWPPAMDWEAQVAFDTFMTQAEAVAKAREWNRGVFQWKKEEHLGRMQASRRFRYMQEIVVHNAETGNAERLVELALSQGFVAQVLRHDVSEAEIGLDVFRQTAERVFAGQTLPWYFSYRVRLGIK